MRYYTITLVNSRTGKAILDAFGKPIGPFTSLLATGATNPGALNVEFDIPVVTFDAPAGAGFLRIWGVPLSFLSQAAQLNQDPQTGDQTLIKVYAGMAKGLPLANPKQQGLILSGIVQQAFGNWQGQEQRVDMVVLGDFGSNQDPKNLSFSWGKGQDLADAITRTLQTAFPGKTITNKVGRQILLPYDPQHGFYQTVGQFARYAADTSAAIVGGQYTGIKIVPTETGFLLFDGTTPATPKQIAVTDLIGQPTWIDFATIVFKTVMRADIAVGDYIKMPQGPQITTAASYSQYRQKATFQGTFLVTSVRHVGHFRQRGADSWVTVFTATTSTT